MKAPVAQVYEFGDFRLDAGKRLLLDRHGAPVPLTPKAFDTLVYLVEHAGAVLRKDELMRAVWADTAVEENNLNQNISILRRALGEERGGHRYIATVPGRGYQFVAAVRTAGAAMSAPGGASIVVLPFANLSAESENEYFCDGLADELINALSRIEGLRVAARTSAFSFKGKQADVREIAEKLGVSFVLEGSVRKSGHRLRIVAQLIGAIDGCHVWSQSYDREMEMRDVFEVQDEITRAVVDALRPRLPGADQSALPRRHTGNVKAHELYLKGRFYLFRMSPSGIQSGMSYLQQAIAADPSDARAQVGLAHAYRMFALTLEMPPGEVLPKAKAAAEKAIELDGTLAEAHAALAFYVFWHDWDWKTTEAHFRRALELDPNSPDAHWMYAHLHSNIGRHAEALARVARARELDPLSGLIHAMEGQFLLHAGHTDEAIVRLREAIELDANSRVAHLFLASACIEAGLLDEAVAEARAAHAVAPGNTNALAFEAFANARLGHLAEARAALERLLQLSETRFVPPYHIAIVYDGLGDHEHALSWLERVFEQRDPKMAFLKVEPKWRDLRANQRFVRLLKRMDLFP